MDIHEKILRDTFNPNKWVNVHKRLIKRIGPAEAILVTYMLRKEEESEDAWILIYPEVIEMHLGYPEELTEKICAKFIEQGLILTRPDELDAETTLFQISEDVLTAIMK